MAFFLRFPGTEVRLAPGESILGRERTCHVRIDDASVSRRHARLLVIGESLTIEDLDSKNGVKVNGVRIGGPVALKELDLIAAGQREFVIRAAAGDTVEGEYQTPILRTCRMCRALTEQNGEQCPRCGADVYMVGDLDDTRRKFEDPEGRRGSERTQVNVRALYVSAQFTIEGVLTDISIGGAFLAALMRDVPRTPCEVVVRPKESEPPLKLEAEVVHASFKPPGMGLRFMRLHRDAQKWLLSVGAAPKP